MEADFLQDKPELILAYPHKSKFNRIGYLFIISSFFIVISILNHLKRYRTDFSDKMIIVIVLIYFPILVCFMGYYLFINGVKLEIYENNVIKYYTYGRRGYSVLHFKFKLEDIEQIKIQKRPFNCLKLTLKIRNPIFYGLHEKRLNKLMNVNIITDRKNWKFLWDRWDNSKENKEE
ncbi:hypothetical protein [Bulleidia extructa]|uniref:hypothetical protein n=1 Tax=Bulleidia extructa TaxID=118748 RepID=UPI003BF0D287